MTDSNDPFAARPYVPPTGDGAAASDDGNRTPEAAPAPASADAPRDSAEEPTVALQDDVTHAAFPQPDAPDDASAAPTPASDAYTHRFPAATGDPVAQAGTSAPPAPPPFDTTRTDGLPPFAEPTVTLPASGSGGDGGQYGGGVADKPRKRRGRKLIATLAGALALILLAGAAGFGGAWLYDESQDADGDQSTVSSLDSGKTTQTKAPAGTVEQVAQKVLPSVVQINVKGAEESGSGTGIIISDDGEILTNNHVVEVAADSGTITVAFNDGTNAKAEIVGRDAKTDIAVIKAEGKTGLTPATLGTSADLTVGQEVVAIGSPFGLESTVTQGIISALNRPVSSSDGSGSSERTTFPAVQTDAAINPGNSGGPLVDLQGRVIAFNSAIRSGTTSSGDAGSIGLGFAIPIDLAKNVSKQLLDGKEVQHAQIGVQVNNFLGEDGITGVGAEVKDVTSGGAGDKAGLKEGDVITAVNGNLIASSEALVASVRGFNPGESITITYTRDGKKDEVEVELDSDGGATD
ncbi:trypsin-like peptidase domain-containing protein [Aeromicrobium sp.]|uniref:trypsin-like peptidase domain-containing protein n=1 Tax=Aeromicrobium sp. TaxID=1871063 RepID=UPI00262887FC|nr:trypsin-like peptidase domain-containing protein [Aeromicrobium sp.]